MHTIEISLPPNELSEIMAKMRLWLDERRFETAGFTCQNVGDAVQIRVNFAAPTEAEAFADRFAKPLGIPALESKERRPRPGLLFVSAAQSAAD